MLAVNPQWIRTTRTASSSAGSRARGRGAAGQYGGCLDRRRGQTFSEPLDISGETGGDYPSLAVDGEGTLHAIYWARVWPPVDDPEDTPVRPIYHRSSTDGGQTFTKRTAIFPGNQDHEKPPLIAADPSSSNLYVV